MSSEQIFEFIGNHPFLIAAFVVSIVLIVVGQLKRSRSNSIEAQEAVRLINQEDAQVVDLRDKKAFESGHILDAKNLLPAKLKNDFPTLKLKLDKPVILVCQMGNTSGGQVANFVEQGCEVVYSLKDGIYGWEKAKLPLET